MKGERKGGAEIVVGIRCRRKGQRKWRVGADGSSKDRRLGGAVLCKPLKTMQIAYIPFGVTRPLLDEFCRTPSTKHASERVYTISLAERRTYIVSVRRMKRSGKLDLPVKEERKKPAFDAGIMDGGNVQIRFGRKEQSERGISSIDGSGRGN